MRVFAALCVCLLASAWGLQRPADAATSASLDVTMDLALVTQLDASGCAAGSGSTQFGAVQPGTTMVTANDCTIGWDTNGPSAMLRLTQTDGAGTAMGGAAAVPDYASGTNDWSTGTAMFGACLRAVDAATTAAWTLDAACPTSNGTYWHGVPSAVGDPNARVAATAASGPGEARLRFGVRTGAAQVPGAYSAQVTFELIAPDPGVNSPPVAGTSTISGTVAIGQTLTAGMSGWDMGTPIGTPTYQWVRCGTSGGTCVDIAGQTASTYLVTGTDGGRTLRVRITVTNGSGSATATSAQTTVVADVVGDEGGTTTTANSTNVVSLTALIPPNVFEGDVLVAQLAVRDGIDVTLDPLPAGWIQIARTNGAIPNNDDRIMMVTFYHVVGTSEPADYTWSWDVTRRATLAMRAFSAVHPTTPIATFSSNVGDSSTATATSVNVPSANSQLLAMFATRETLDLTDNNAPAMTQLWELTNPTGDVSSFALWEPRNAGATGNRTASLSMASEWAAQLIVLEPRP